jgi:TPR repeat protein
MYGLQKLILAGFMLAIALESQVMASPLSEAERAYSAGDYAKAAKLYAPLAKKGNAQARLRLGVIYYLGQGVPQNYLVSAEWLQLAAKQGVAGAQNLLGTMYDLGLDVPQDYSIAAKWYRLSAEQGNSEGQYNLGLMYARELGVPHDYLRAYMWMSLAGSHPQELAFVAKQLSEGQILKAQELARTCTRKKFKGC